MTERNSSRPAPPPLAGKTGTAAAEIEADGGGGSAKDPTDVDVPGGSSPAQATEPWHIDGSGPVPTANGRVRRRWRKVVARTVSKAWGDSLFGMSSQAAFWSALSTAPLLLALLGLTGYVAELFGPGTMTDVRKQTMSSCTPSSTRRSRTTWSETPWTPS